MRLVQASPNVHYGVRPVVARDIADPFAPDLNTAFACLKATAKPIGISFCDASHVRPVVDMFDLALGGAGRFAQRPFCMAVIVHVVPPLRFATEGIEILQAALEAGMIPQICSAGQAGATSPVTLAGALAQGLAECLTGADMINLSVGMLGSIMVASPDAMVIDDDMCGAILRTVGGIKVSPQTPDLTAIEPVVTHDGHDLWARLKR